MCVAVVSVVLVCMTVDFELSVYCKTPWNHGILDPLPPFL